MATQLHVAGKEALEIYNTFTLEKDGNDKIAPLSRQNLKHTAPSKECNVHGTITSSTREIKLGVTLDQYVTHFTTNP